MHHLAPDCPELISPSCVQMGDVAAPRTEDGSCVTERDGHGGSDSTFSPPESLANTSTNPVQAAEAARHSDPAHWCLDRCLCPPAACQILPYTLRVALIQCLPLLVRFVSSPQNDQASSPAERCQERSRFLLPAALSHAADSGSRPAMLRQVHIIARCRSAKCSSAPHHCCSE